MKVVKANQSVVIPENVEASVDKRVITIKGDLGELKRSFRHVDLDIHMEENEEGQKEIVVESWLGLKKKNAAVRTVCSHINNMINGVTKGYRYKMRFVYAHFPVNVSITKNNTVIEIRNFLGEKRVRYVTMKPDVTVDFTSEKDEIAIEGIDIENVSQSAALIHLNTRVRNKDIRKFLDGIYVSEKGFQVDEE
mmetsp:Transcript_1016/g.1584  ORF Transcript_1016/g.1584 Transcript_1016/m.1584 type:complete len:193 (+) Transcript_1016:32-610(+)